MIQVGEMSGNCLLVLKQLTVYYENEDRLERKLKQAFQYPKILLFQRHRGFDYQFFHFASVCQSVQQTPGTGSYDYSDH